MINTDIKISPLESFGCNAYNVYAAYTAYTGYTTLTKEVVIMAVKVDRATRLFANSTKDNVQRARVLAAKEVPYGEKGTTQDLINYVICALSKKPELAHDLYWEGKKLLEGLDGDQSRLPWVTRTPRPPKCTPRRI